MQEKPLITFALFTYNQEQFIEEAVHGAFSQTYSPLEIILSDDGSSDRTYDILCKLASEYHGPHKIILNRNNPNLGICPHVNKMFEMAHGEIVVLAAGDDISLPDRTTKTYEIFSKNSDVLAVSLHHIKIDREGNVISTAKNRKIEGNYKLKEYGNRYKQPIDGCAMAYKKILFEYFGPLVPWCKAEDAALVFRSLLIGSAYHHNSVGVYYRELKTSLSTIPKIDMFFSIYRQNARDFIVALNTDNYFDTIKDDINKILRNMLAKAIILLRFRSTNYKFSYFTCHIFPSPLFSILEKFKRFKSTI
jgi:glycosyltransferase involved in cell wall biosynthesis